MINTLESLKQQNPINNKKLEGVGWETFLAL